MSVAGISSSSFLDPSITPAGEDKKLQFQKELQQLSQDLKSGNTSAAQADFAKIAQDIQNGLRHHHHRGASGVHAIIDHFDPLPRTGGLTAAQQGSSALQGALQQFGQSNGASGASQPDISSLLSGVSLSA